MKISIVTPSFNQGAFLEASMLSVLGQEHADLEYIVMDGGSTDGSVEIIGRHAARLAHWQSAPDDGQYAAVTEGHRRTTGEIMGWLNSDDMLLPGALSIVDEIFTQCPEVQWLTTLRLVRLDERGRAVRCLAVPGYSREGFFRGENLPRPGEFALGWIQQESTFWRRSLWERAGAQVGAEFGLAGDFELWARFFQHAELFGVEATLGGFRYHGNQKTGTDSERYLAEAEVALARHGGRRHTPIERLFRKASRSIRGGALHPCRIVRHSRLERRWHTLTVYE